VEKFVIQGGNKLQGNVTISGSKNSCLPVMAACLLAKGKTRIRNVPGLRDVRTMAKVLEVLGARVSFEDHTAIVDTSGCRGTEAPYELVKTMRASYYVLGPLLAVQGKATVSLPGGCTIGARPINLHIDGMRALGAHVEVVHGYIQARGERLEGARMDLSGQKGSSVGATINVMMAAALAEGTTVIKGAAMEPEVVDVAGFIRAMGGKIEGDGTSELTIHGRAGLSPADYEIIPDRIEAGTFGVAAAMVGGEVGVERCRPEHLEATLAALSGAGAHIDTIDGGFLLRSDGARSLRPFNVEATQYPGFPTDMQAQFMALATLVPGVSTIKESIFENRFLHAVELARMGAQISLEGPVASVTGVGKLTGAPVMASDLRASAALVLAGLAADGETWVYRVYHLDRGYEAIEQKLRGLGARCARINV
jgi:UDP-N-acetylglucosamine 1-carboxyvinyltransferase